MKTSTKLTAVILTALAMSAGVGVLIGAIGCQQKQVAQVDDDNKPTPEIPVPQPVPGPVEQAPPPVAGGECAEGWPCAYDQAVRDSVSPTQVQFSASKVGDMCPNWGTMTEDQRREFWVHLWWATAKFESGRDPRAMYWEKTMGNDEVTGQLTISEGMLQLSYQDSPWAKCGFDYASDKAMHLDDLSRRPVGKQSWFSVHDKTINQAERNLVCGNKIVTYYATKVSKFSNYSLFQMLSNYWAAIRDDWKTKIKPEFMKRNHACF